MRNVLLLLAVMLATPALGAECYQYVSESGETLDASRPGELVIGADKVCELFGTGTGSTVMRAQCGDLDFAFFSAASERGGEPNLVVFHNELWYANCD